MDHVLDQKQLRSLYSVGLLNEAETFNPHQHPDALDEHGRPSDDVVLKDVWYSERGNPEYVVQDRVVWLLTPVSVSFLDTFLRG